MKKSRFGSLKERFDAIQAVGMAALAAGDYDGFGEAIRLEREIIDAQAAVIAERIETSRGAKPA